MPRSPTKSLAVIALAAVAAAAQAQSTRPFAAGDTHTLGVDASGRLWAFGSNLSGQLGNPGRQRVQAWPVPVPGVQGVRTLTAGQRTSFVIDLQGRLFAFGDGRQGQLGLGDDTDRLAPTQIQGLPSMRLVSHKGAHGLAADDSGALWVWGRQVEGQTGLGNSGQGTPPVLAPVPIANLPPILDIAAGFRHSLAVDSTGDLWAFGANFFGELGLGDTTLRSTPTRVSNLSNIIAIAADELHSLAVDSSGQLYSWGANRFGELGLGDDVQRTSPTAVPGMTNIVAVSAGYGFSLALDRNGQAWGFGANRAGQLGIGDTTNRNLPTAIPTPGPMDWIEAGNGFSFFGPSNSGPIATGFNSSGQLGIGDQQTRIEAETVIPNAPETFGTDCPGSNGLTPSVDLASAPGLGRTLTFRIDNLPSSSPFGVWLLASRGFVFTDLTAVGMPGCSLTVEPEATLGLSFSGSGTALASIPVPNVTGLVGVRLHSQFAIRDAGANAAGATITRARMATAGPNW